METFLSRLHSVGLNFEGHAISYGCIGRQNRLTKSLGDITKVPSSSVRGSKSILSFLHQFIQ